MATQAQDTAVDQMQRQGWRFSHWEGAWAPGVGGEVAVLFRGAGVKRQRAEVEAAGETYIDGREVCR